MSTLNSSSSTTPTNNSTSSSSSSSLSTPIVPAAPFHNVRVFLHIREQNDIDGSDRTKHHAKKALRTLGASLTLSENTADLIIFHCGNDSLLANATARGKVVVHPAYLQACVARGMRLPVDEFLVQSPLSTSTTTRTTGITTTRTIGKRTEKKGEDMNRNHHVITSPSLPHKGSKVSVDVGKEAHSSSSVLETEKLKPVKASTSAIALSEVPYLDDDDDEEIEEEEKEEKEMKNVDYSAKNNQKSADNIETNTPLLSNDNLESRTNTRSGKNKTTSFASSHLTASTNGNNNNNNNNNQQKQQEQEQQLSSSKGVEESVSAVNKENNSNNTTRKVVGGSGCTVSRGGDKRPPDTIESSSKNKKKNRKEEDDTTTESIEETTPSAMTSTDHNLITPLFPPQHDTTTTTRKRKRENISVSTASVPLRIAVSGENEDVIHFLSDVVEQLGANCVPRVFGRGRKPTHLVVEGRGELTAVVLLAIALGIPVLTPQWLYDAISLGAFPNIMESHLHPIYNHNNNNNNSNNNNNNNSNSGGGNGKEGSEKNEGSHKEEEKEEENGCPGVGRTIKRRRKHENDIGGKLVDLFGEDVGPHYKAIFLGMSFAFVSHSPLAHTDQFIELVRILGGTVSRSPLGVNLSVIVDLGYGTATQQEEEKEKKEEYVKGRKNTNGKKRGSRQSIVKEGKDEIIRETQSLSMTYRTVLSDNNAGVSSHPSQHILQGIMDQRLQNGLSVVPIVSVEWIIQCILLGEVTDMTPFEVPLTVNTSIKTVMEAKRHEDTTTTTTNNSNSNNNDNSNSCCSSGSSGGNMNEKEELFTPPEQTTWRDGKNRQVKSKHNNNTVMSRLPLLIADPLAKTAEGPSSAKKSAEQQLNTQQLLLLDDSDVE